MEVSFISSQILSYPSGKTSRLLLGVNNTLCLTQTVSFCTGIKTISLLWKIISCPTANVSVHSITLLLLTLLSHLLTSWTVLPPCPPSLEHPSQIPLKRPIFLSKKYHLTSNWKSLTQFHIMHQVTSLPVENPPSCHIQYLMIFLQKNQPFHMSFQQN